MGNCLVTKLKGVVDNDNLDVFGQVVFIYKKNDDNWINLHATNSGEIEATIVGATVSTVAGDVVKVDDTHVLLSTNKGFKCTSLGEYFKIIVPNKYKVTSYDMSNMPNAIYKGDIYYSPVSKIVLNSTNVDGIGRDEFLDVLRFDLDSMSAICKSRLLTLALNLQDFPERMGQFKGSLSSISDCPTLQYLSLVGTNIGGDLSNLGSLTTLSRVDIIDTPINGNIASLSSITNLKRLNLLRTNVSGSIEEFVQGQRSAGRTETTGDDTGVFVQFSLSSVTFNGNPIPNKIDRYITWTPTTITFDGVTIDA
jgi:hypothetical protein